MAIDNTVFVWHGMDHNGHKSSGEVLAASAALARAKLRKQGIAAKSVKKKSIPFLTVGAGNIKAANIAVLIRQLATMMKAGIPLVQAFDIVAEGTDHEKMRELITTIRSDVSSGTGLAGALAKHPLFLMSCSALWWPRAKIRGHWKSCSTAWRLIKRRPRC